MPQPLSKVATFRSARSSRFRPWACAGWLILGGLLRAAEPIARHVVVIGLDGCRPELLRDHATGALRTFWREGTVSWNAAAAVPSVTQVKASTSSHGTR